MVIATAAAAAIVCAFLPGREKRARASRWLVRITRLDLALHKKLRRAGVQLRWSPVNTWIGAVLTAGVLGAAVADASGVVLGIVAAVVLPALIVRGRLQDEDEEVELALPTLLDQLARSTRSGASLAQAFGDAPLVIGGTLAKDLGDVQKRVAAGQPLSSGLQSWSESRPIPVLRMLVAAVELGNRLGGLNAIAFDHLALAVRGSTEHREEAKALATQSVMSAVLIGSAPLVFGCVLIATGTLSLASLMGSPLLSWCITGGVALEVVGAYWMRQIVRGVN